MGEQDLVSIIIPVYNAETFLERCVTSALNQTYNNIEVILINDGSSDTSGEICNLLSVKDKRVKVLHQKNGGVSVARNNGIDVARGEFIQFIDADDYIEDNMLKALMEEMNTECDIVMCGYKKVFIDNEGKLTTENSSVFRESNITKQQFIGRFGVYLESYYINYIWNKLYRTKVIKDNSIRFDNSIGWGEDLIFNISYLNYCNKISIIKNRLYNYVNYNENSITSTYNENLYDNQQSMYTSIRRFLIENNSYHTENKNIVEGRYMNVIIGCIGNLFHVDAGYNNKELRSKISNIVENEEIISDIKYFDKGDLQGKIVGRMIRKKYKNLIVYYFKTKVFVRERMKPLYKTLKKVNSYMETEKNL